MEEEFNTDDMLDIYLFEMEQLLGQLQDIVLKQKDAGSFGEESINDIFRTMHTIKGSSGIMMFDGIKAVSHKMEDVFYYLRESHPQNVPHLELVEHILAVADFISGEMEKIKNRGAADGDSEGMIAELDRFLDKIEHMGNTGEKKEIPQNVHEEPTQFYIAPASSSVSGSEEMEARAKPPEGNTRGIAPGDFVIKSREPDRQKKPARDKKAEKANFISVSVHKMDQLMNLIGELSVSEFDVLQNPDLKVQGLNLTNFNKAAAQLVKISTDLRNLIMSMRMVPLASTFQKMNRIVFDVSRKLGKDIEFEMTGENTEVDKNIIEHISDPLMHLVRNAADHGIETQKERERSGKTGRGKITLSAKNESGKLWITVEDNGRGLDREKILDRAKKRGLLDKGRPESAYTDKEVYQFITYPGFSTNEQVTEYSGRGVGMDVVVQNIQSIGGSLEIDSTPGAGSIMSLKIPLTLPAGEESSNQAADMKDMASVYHLGNMKEKEKSIR